ncbi:hypothetical protein HK105_208843 [Polyrhizophydium stewartii]|uniref:Retrotransposon gag domain-containing protein n=1 Tax=Polyrhizophydium stewartii TaxID=2732419 RepID=A0ABR4MWN3_9FUNG|nr:hypothetical protein HK105_001790 [Polyrhizophydium stewartii]
MDQDAPHFTLMLQAFMAQQESTTKVLHLMQQTLAHIANQLATSHPAPTAPAPAPMTAADPPAWLLRLIRLPRTLQGDEDAGTYMAWERAMADVLSLLPAGTTAAQRVVIIASYLDDTAAAWFAEMRSRPGFTELSDSERLALLRACFVHPEAVSAPLARLRTLRQNTLEAAREDLGCFESILSLAGRAPSPGRAVGSPSDPSAASGLGESVPMVEDLNAARPLSASDRSRYRSEGRCFRCHRTQQHAPGCRSRFRFPSPLNVVIPQSPVPAAAPAASAPPQQPPQPVAA